MEKLKQSLVCILIASSIALTICAAQFFHASTKTSAAVPVEIAESRKALVGEVAEARKALVGEVRAARVDLAGQVEGARKDLLIRTERQVGALRSDVMGEVKEIRLLANRRFTDVLERADSTLFFANLVRKDLLGQATTLNTTIASAVKPIGELATTYKELPAQLGAVLRPSWLSLEPEITCRHADGTGYGGCARGRFNALLGEGVNFGGVFVKRFPEFSLSVNGIANDVHKFTTKATAPRGFWGTLKDVATTGSGIARAGAAAGLF